MPRFGLFQSGSDSPLQEIEGDYMKREGDIITVFRKNPNPTLGNIRDTEVGFRLDKSQTVKEIK
jgi:hypothetical protein